MRIGIVGSGNMGRAIGVRFSRLGHEVVFGGRTASAGEAAAALAGGSARAGTNDAAVAHGEVVIWTIRKSDPSAVLADASLLEGKIVVDLNNRDYATEVQGGAWFGVAIAEALQEAAPGARVVKTLNLVAMESFDTSPERLRAAGAQVFVAGADASAKAVVGGLLGELGFAAVDMGSGRVALRAVEALGDVIRLLMIDQRRGGRANLQLHFLPDPDLGEIGGRAASGYR